MVYDPAAGLKIPQAGGSQLLTETFPGFPKGSNVALPQQELDDTEARIIQDGLLDYPGLTRRRGPVKGVSGLPALTRKATSLVIGLDPSGSDRYAALTGDAANGYFTVYNSTLSAYTELAWPHALPTTPASGSATAYRIVDAKPAVAYGTMVGVSSAYDSNAPNQALAFWGGGVGANVTTTGSVTRGSVALTVASGTGISPGMWVFGNTDEPYTNTLIGQVMSISGTSVTLTQVSPYNVTAKSLTFQTLRGIYPKVTQGRITCDTTAATVNGGKTKFVSQIGSGVLATSWQLYRQSDLAYIGKVLSVASDISLTLTASAAVACADEAYVAIRADADYTMVTTTNASKVGFLNAVYAGRQWYANCGAQFSKTTRVWFSDQDDPEMLDVTNNGNWLDITSTSQINEPIKALMPAYNALVAIKESEAFAISGSTISNFSVKKIHDDGTLSGQSVVRYGGGMIWAGRQGIHYFDGINVTNLTQNSLGDVWKNSIKTFDPSKYRMYGMMARNHYILHIENLAPTIAIVKGNTSTTPNRWMVVINMETGAITWMTNVGFRGAVNLPAARGLGTVWYIVNDASKGNICSADDFFDAEGVDQIATDGGTVGPDWFVESKKFSAGDDLRLKRFKQLSIHYLVQGGSIKVDTVLGLNNIGAVLSSDFPASVYTWDTLRTLTATWDLCKATFATWNDIVQGVFVPKRVRFLKRSQHFSFRLYQSSSAISRLKVGPYQIAYKIMRPGRV